MSDIEHKYPQCPSTIMTLIDPRPCRVRSNGQEIPEGASYVMDLMWGDLHDYRRKFPSGCLRVIARKAMEAIRCFHRADWVHSDVKERNFLWRGEDDMGCPQEVRLADYGLSGRRGATNDLFNGYYDHDKDSYSAYYLVSDVFERPFYFSNDTDVWKLNLQRPPKQTGGKAQYEYQPQLDWCSYHYMFPEVKGMYWSGDCGLMGPGRTEHVIVQPHVSN